MKYFIIILSLISSIYANNLKPYKEIIFNGGVKDMVLNNNNLIVGTDTGKLQVYDLKLQKIIKTIQLPKIKDFMGDIIDTRVASVDYLNKKYLLLSDSGIGGYTNIWLYKDNKLEKIISPKDELSIVKARFIDDNHILFGFLSNEVALYDIKNKKILYTHQLSESKFSDFALNENKTVGAFSCESGIIYIVNIKNGKIMKELKGIHVDNVYKVDMKNNIVVGAGQDRRASYFNLKTGEKGYFSANFIIYSAGLSPSGKKAAYAIDENNDIAIYNLNTKSKTQLLKGQKSRLNTIIFQDENTLFSAGDDETVMMWKLNKKENK